MRDYAFLYRSRTPIAACSEPLCFQDTEEEELKALLRLKYSVSAALESRPTKDVFLANNQTRFFKIYKRGNKAFANEKEAYELLRGTNVTLPGVAFHEHEKFSIIDMPLAVPVSRPTKYDENAQILRDEINELIRKIDSTDLCHNDLTILKDSRNPDSKILHLGQFVRFQDGLHVLDWELASEKPSTQIVGVMTEKEDASSALMTAGLEASTGAKKQRTSSSQRPPTNLPKRQAQIYETYNFPQPYRIKSQALFPFEMYYFEFSKPPK